VSQNAAYSRISLALLEDSGWYRVYNSSAEEGLLYGKFEWGKNQGLGFLTEPCGSRGRGYTCDPNAGVKECTPSRQGPKALNPKTLKPYNHKTLKP
jgi:hypothetical protein